MANAGFAKGAWELAAKGLGYAGERRDATWAHLKAQDLARREAEDPDNPGMPLDTPERREVQRISQSLPAEERPILLGSNLGSREELLARPNVANRTLFFLAGEYRRILGPLEQEATEYERSGQIANAVASWARDARAHNALGNFKESTTAYERGLALSERLARPSIQVLQLSAARWERALSHDERWEEQLAEVEPLLQQREAENQWASAIIRAAGASIHARLGNEKEALRLLGTLQAPLERAPGWSPNYSAIACAAANALWDLERTDHLEVIERSLLEKVIAPDYRYPMTDARLALAQLCGLQGRHDEARDWFAKARTVLEEQGARPLRAIVDYTEAQMYQRRAKPGDIDLAAPLLATALAQFRDVGMTGWVRRGEELQASLRETGFETT